jgi:CheY-like chemotaxis protein
MGQGDADDVCVLVVDDQDGIRESLRDVIEMGGSSLALATRGDEALPRLAMRGPCPIVLDQMMPRMTGLERMRALQASPDLATLPVVISTSAPALAPTGAPVLSKPIDITAPWGWMRLTCECSKRTTWIESALGVMPTKGSNGGLPT